MAGSSSCQPDPWNYGKSRCRVCVWEVNEWFHLRGTRHAPTLSRDVTEKINVLKRIYQLMLKGRFALSSSSKWKTQLFL